MTPSRASSAFIDYGGFPPHTYQLRYDAPGDPSLAARAASLLQSAGLNMALDPNRGFDHGVFVPLKVVFPAADVPVVEMSVDRTLDPARHLSAGRALSALRDQGIAIIASGMSFHNLQGFGDPGFTAPSEAFDAWLGETLSLEPSQRNARLEQWEAAPAARLSHPRAEHLLPLMVASGAATGAGRRVYSEHVLGVAIAGFRFD